MPTLKLCKDLECAKVTYRCRECSNICCIHFCSNKDNRGFALCGSCILRKRNIDGVNDNLNSIKDSP